MNEAIALNLSIITEGVGIYLWDSLCIMAIFKGDTKFVLCMWIYKYEGRTISNNTHLMSRYLVQKSLTNDKKKKQNIFLLLILENFYYTEFRHTRNL